MKIRPSLRAAFGLTLLSATAFVGCAEEPAPAPAPSTTPSPAPADSGTPAPAPEEKKG